MDKKFTNITDESVEAAWSDIKGEIATALNPFEEVINFMESYAKANPAWIHTHYRVDFKERMVLEMKARNGRVTYKDKYVPKKQVTR